MCGDMASARIQAELAIELGGRLAVAPQHSNAWPTSTCRHSLPSARQPALSPDPAALTLHAGDLVIAHRNRHELGLLNGDRGATARQICNFGDAHDYGAIGAEYFSLAAGTDIAPLLHGLDGDSCHAPHWGYVLSGTVIITYDDASEETCSGGMLFYWPPGHSVRVEADVEMILFSPQAEHLAVIDHMLDKLG